MEKKEYRYTIIIEPCEEGGYFATCPAFPGCQVQGNTYEETLKEMKTAVFAFIEDYLEDNEPIPDDEVTITFFNSETNQKVSKIGRIVGRSE